jgi:hypothetical protein
MLPQVHRYTHASADAQGPLLCHDVYLLLLVVWLGLLLLLLSSGSLKVPFCIPARAR